MLALDLLDVLGRARGRHGLGLRVPRRAELHDRDRAQRRAGPPRERVGTAQRLAALVGVDVGHADRVHRTARLPAVRHDGDRARGAVHQPVGRRARQDPADRPATGGSDHEQPGPLGLGRLVQGARGARARQLAALDRDALGLELARDAPERLGGVGAEVVVQLAGGGPLAPGHGGDDQRRAGEARGRDAEVDGGVIGADRVVADEDRLAHRDAPSRRPQRAQGSTESQ